MAHENCVNCICINETFNIIVTGGEDGMLYVRNLYDLELLTSIKVKINNEDKAYSIIDIKISNASYLYVSVFVKDKYILLGYTVNGVNFSKTSMLFNNFEFTNTGKLVVGRYTVNKIVILDPIDLTNVNFLN